MLIIKLCCVPDNIKGQKFCYSVKPLFIFLKWKKFPDDGALKLTLDFKKHSLFQILSDVLRC